MSGSRPAIIARPPTEAPGAAGLTGTSGAPAVAVLAGLAAFLLVWLVAGATAARADGDAANFERLGFDDRPPFCLFLDTVALRDEYADRGLAFRGPDLRDGGGVLNVCAFFLVTGISPPNFLAFNEQTEYSDGGVPRDPQTIRFAAPMDFVKVQVGAPIEVDFPATLTAFGVDDEELASATVGLQRQTVPLLVEAPGIVRVMLTAPGARYILDDLLWGQSAGGDLALAGDEVTLSVPAGETAVVAVTVTNHASVPLGFFTREGHGQRAGAAGVPAAGRDRRDHRRRGVEIVRLGDPGPLANLPAGPAQLPAAVVPDVGGDALAGPDDRGLADEGGALDLLVYTEVDPNGGNFDTDLDLALRSLGIPYTGVYGAIAFFREQLTGGDWDAVVFDHQSAFIYEFDYGIYDELLAFVEQGGRLILGSWQIGDVPDHPLWEALGVRWLEDYETPAPLAWTDAEPRFFDVPNDVPDFTELEDFYQIDGHLLEASADAVVLARLLPSAATAGWLRGAGIQALAPSRLPPPVLVLANDGRTIFRGFIDGNNTSDLDADGVLDTVELWRGLVEQMFAPDVPWLTATPEAEVAAGQALDLELAVDATDLAPGEYAALLQLRSNEAVHNVYDLALRLTVTAGPTGVPPDARADLSLAAYPNPFNPRTTVAFGLPRSAPVSLHIYAPTGRLVRTLLDGAQLPAGRHERAWDGRDRTGRPAAAGHYLVRLSAAGAQRVQRLVLVR